MPTTSYLDEVFGPQGALASRFPLYSLRQGQVDLACAVDAAITQGKHLVAEAGTGTGKSLAYAVPAIYHAVHSGKPAVLVTANIALQEQLVKKDLPLLAELLPWPFSFALMKGWSNFLCLDRLKNGAPGKLDPIDQETNDVIAAWAAQTETGDISELPFEPPKKVWSRFSIASEDCVGKDCPSFGSCHPQAARDKAMKADVVVTNYHLFFADMKVRQVTGGMAQLLPHYKTVIFDEGHKTVEIARDFFGFHITEGSIQRAGSLLPSGAKIKLERASEAFFKALLNYKRSPQYKTRLRKPQAVPSQELDLALNDAETAYFEILREMPAVDSMTIDTKRYAKKIASRCIRVTQLREHIAHAMRLYALPQAPWGKHPDHEQGDTPETRWYWSDPSRGGDNTVLSEAQLAKHDEDVFFIEEREGSVTLGSKPISVAKILRARLFDAGAFSVSVTSATLLARGSFDYVNEELGVDKPQSLVAASPFTWATQALLVLPQDIPEPNDPQFTSIAAQKCLETIKLARGRTLALFTSYKNMNAAHQVALRSGYRVLRQGDLPRTQLIDEFRRDVNSVLMGVESFWAGVDVPGESLSCVFIDKLPFTTPDDPVMDALSERDRDWFMKYSVPKAIISFKQGFGRLIRRTTDRGVVVVLDKRITTKFYGKQFLAALPPQIQRSFVLDDVKNFLDGETLIVTPPQRVPTSLCAQ